MAGGDARGAGAGGGIAALCRSERRVPGTGIPPPSAQGLPWGPRALTGLFRVRAVLHAAEDAGQAGLADAVLAQQDHLVEVAVGVAARGDDGVGGVGGPALPVLLAGAVRGAAHQAGELALRQGGPQVPLVHRHAAPVQVLVHGEGHAAAPLVQVAQLVAAVQSHGATGGEESRAVSTRRPCSAPAATARASPAALPAEQRLPRGAPRREGGKQKGIPRR